MTRQEAYGFFEEIKNRNKFEEEEIDFCLDTQAEKIAQMEDIFDLKEEDDYTYLFAVAEFLASDGNIQLIKNNLLEEYPLKKEIDHKEIRQPDKNDKLLVLTAFENNPLFFSMAWNWIQICKVSLKEDVPESW